METAAGDVHHVRLQSFVQVEALDDDTVRVVAGHMVIYELGASGQTLDQNLPWVEETTQTHGSAALEKGIAELAAKLVEATPQAIRVFAEQLKAVTDL